MWGRQKAPKVEIGPEDLLVTGHHCVILGEPGAGKTTLLRFLARHMLTADSHSREDSFQHPLVVECRSLAEDEALVERLCGVFGITVGLRGNKKFFAKLRRQEKQLMQEALCEMLNSVPVLVLIDGLDEVAADQRSRLIQELNSLLPAVEHSTFLITCRFGALLSTIQGASLYGVQPFNGEQIKQFSARWFGDRKGESDRFLTELKRATYVGMSATPLHLANLCLVFEAKRRLPESPIRVYEAIVSLRLERWDRERGVRRESEYGKSFGPNEKHRFLAAMAFDLARRLVGARFNDRQLETAYWNIAERFQLPRAEAGRVAGEIESHSGLIVQTSDFEYEFYHLSIFEYLCAGSLISLAIGRMCRGGFAPDA